MEELEEAKVKAYLKRYLVNYEGKVVSLQDLKDMDLLEFKMAENFYVPHSPLRGGGKIEAKYFADIKGTDNGWEITKTAYLRNKKQEQAKG